MEQARFFELEELQGRRNSAGKAYLEFLRIPAMSAGVYVLPRAGKDLQSAHRQDELYYVARGRARLRVGAEERPVSAGSVIFVPAGLDHKFLAIEEELTVLVFFAPAEN